MKSINESHAVSMLPNPSLLLYTTSFCFSMFSDALSFIRWTYTHLIHTCNL